MKEKWNCPSIHMVSFFSFYLPDYTDQLVFVLGPVFVNNSDIVLIQSRRGSCNSRSGVCRRDTRNRDSANTIGLHIPCEQSPLVLHFPILYIVT